MYYNFIDKVLIVFSATAFSVFIWWLTFKLVNICFIELLQTRRVDCLRKSINPTVVVYLQHIQNNHNAALQLQFDAYIVISCPINKSQRNISAKLLTTS